jgi:hypothetical protein
MPVLTSNNNHIKLGNEDRCKSEAIQFIRSVAGNWYCTVQFHCIPSRDRKFSYCVEVYCPLLPNI